MPRNQLIYNQVGVFAGPAPSSGYHFIAQDGALSNQSTDYNLVFPLNRVNSISWGIAAQRTNVSHLGDLGTLKRPILAYTDVNLDINYLMMGLANEARIGMHMNIPSGDPLTGNFAYGTGRVCPILGYYSRDYSRTTDISGVNWPMKEYRDARNIFVAVRKDTLDFNPATGDIANESNYENNIFVICFGDCYLNSYNFSAGVRTLPNATINYGCNNVVVYDNNNENDIPSIDTKTQEIRSGIKFRIPSAFQGTGLPTVLLPSDISLSIKQRNLNSEDLENTTLDFKDIKIQNFSFNFNLNRRPLYAVGHKYPLDRRPVFPIFCNLNFECIDGDPKAGSMASLLKNDEEYDIQIKMSYQKNNQYFSGIAVQYDWIGAKFNNLNSELSISNRKKSEFGFSVEMNPTDISKGFFISGYLSLLSMVIPKMYLGDFFFSSSQFGYLLTEDLDQFVVAEEAVKPVF